MDPVSGYLNNRNDGNYGGFMNPYGNKNEVAVFFVCGKLSISVKLLLVLFFVLNYFLIQYVYVYMYMFP